VLAIGTHRGGIIAGPGTVPKGSPGGGDPSPANLRWLLTLDDVAVT
jgi:hypothetical protein